MKHIRNAHLQLYHEAGLRGFVFTFQFFSLSS